MNEYQARLRAYRRAAGKDPEVDTSTRQEPDVPGQTMSAGVEKAEQWRRTAASQSAASRTSTSKTAPSESKRKTPTHSSSRAPAAEADRERTVAILLRSLSSEEGASVLRALPADISERIAQQALTMGEPSDQEIEAAYRILPGIPGFPPRPVPLESGRTGNDFSIRTKAGKTEADRSMPPLRSADAPGWTCAEEALVRAFGPDKAHEIMSRSIPRIGRIWLSFLEELQPRQLSVLFARESLEVKALVIAHASPEVGSRIIGQSGPEEQKSLVRRLARMREVPSDIVRTIADSLKERIRTLGTDAEREIEGVSALAEIMKHLEDNTLLKSIEDELPELGQALSDELYSIEMVHRVQSRTLEDILTRLDDIEIARLLKGKEESVRRRILEHVSENRSLIISEEYRDLGPQLRSDVDALTHQFVLMLREADPNAEAALPQA